MMSSTAHQFGALCAPAQMLIHRSVLCHSTFIFRPLLQYFELPSESHSISHFHWIQNILTIILEKVSVSPVVNNRAQSQTEHSSQ
jgi:hypothetical protein